MTSISEILIEPARLSHLSDLVRLASQAQALHAQISSGDFKSVVDEDELRDLFCALIDRADSHVAVAEIGEKTEGFIWADVQNRPETALTYPITELFLQQICIDERYRRKGIGAALMRYLENFALKIGAEEIALGTWVGNATAQNFFRSLGYETATFLLRKTPKPRA